MGSPRTRRLDPDEEQKLLAKANPHLYALIVAALETGCRVGELLSLQWHQVRWTENVLLLPAGKTKTSEARDVPMTTRLRAVLEMRRHGADGKEFGPDAYVFGNEVGERIGTIKTAWRAACRRAGIKDLHFHDLRREFASRLLEYGDPAVYEPGEGLAAYASNPCLAMLGRYARQNLFSGPRIAGSPPVPLAVRLGSRVYSGLVRLRRRSA